MPNALPKRHRVIVHLIRHATNVWDIDPADPGLSEAGLNDCMSFDVEKHSLSEIRTIISSPLIRSLDTARELFKGVLLKNPGEVKIDIWPELQSSRGGGYKEFPTLPRLRKYGEDLINITRIVKANAQKKDGGWHGTEQSYKVVKEWLLKQGETDRNEPYEIAVVSHQCILRRFFSENKWRRLTWITCIFNEQGELQRMPSDDFNKLKLKLSEKQLAAARRMQEEMDQAEEAWEKKLLDQEKELKQEQDANVRKRHMDMTRRMLQQYDTKVSKIGGVWLDLEKEDEQAWDSWERLAKILDTEARKNHSQSDMEMRRRARGIRPPESKAEKTLRAYMRDWTDKIHEGLLITDHPYQGKSFEFLGFRHLLHADAPHRLMLHHIVSSWVRATSSPPEPPPVMLGVGHDMSMGIYDRQNHKYILDLKPLLEPAHLTGRQHRHALLKQMHQEIRMLRGDLPADEVASIEDAKEYPLLPIMVKIRFPDKRGVYRGYLPGPEGHEMEAHLFKVPEGEEPAPEFPRPYVLRKRPRLLIT